MTNTPERIPGRWYWVTENGSDWFPARHDELAAGGWSNGDTWEDFNLEVTAWKLIPLAGDLP